MQTTAREQTYLEAVLSLKSFARSLSHAQTSSSQLFDVRGEEEKSFSIGADEVFGRHRKEQHMEKNMTGRKIALVTGVSSGIGRATAVLLSERGFRVFGTMRKPNLTDGPLRNVEL